MTQAHDKTAPRAPRLADMLCFAVYGASQAFGRVYKTLLEPMGLTYSQFLVMLALFERDDRAVGACLVRDLGESLGLDSNTLTPLLKRMEQSGLLTRRRDPDDERQVRVRLTAKGEALRAPATEIPERLLARTGMSLAEVQDLHARVRRLDANLRAHAEGLRP